MDATTDFPTLLRRCIRRARRTTTELAQLTGLSVHTIGNWTEGKVRRPRVVTDVLKLARALELDRHDTIALLAAAGHPSLFQLQAQAQQTGDTKLAALLAPWEGPLVPPHPLSPAPSPLAPRYQLRAPVQDFVGRTAELATVRGALLHAARTRSAVAITGVQGMGGIGKTELAYLAAQDLREEFPDAQIVLALHGTSSSPLSPEQALQTVIRAFIPDTVLPDDLHGLEALYRTQLATRHVLILADDAASAAQVEPLLPPAGSALLVTSRVRFALAAMTTIDLEQLPLIEAVQLLRAICARLTADQAAALAQACGYLPLALRVSASLLHTTPALAVANYLEQFADERRHLALLRNPDEPQHDVEATLALSYTQLEPTARAVFRQLGIFVADFTSELAQAVVIVPEDRNMTATLHHLLRRNLVLYDTARGRWRLHDLVRDLAQQQLEAMGEAEAAQWRYARAAVAIAQDIQEEYQAGGEKALLALAQFDAERAHIDAGRDWAQLHAETTAGDQLLLNAALATRYFQHLRYDQRYEGIPLWERVRVAARRLGDRHSEGQALRSLGVAHGRLGEIPTTISYFEQACTTFRELGDQSREGHTLNNLGLAYYSLGQLPKAIAYYDQALAIACEIGDRSGQGRALGNLGLIYTRLGELPKAISCYEQRLAFTREVGDRVGEGIALTNLGNTYSELGDTRRAIECCEAARSIARATGDRQMEGYALSYLAPAQARQGDMARAGSTYTQARALLQEVNDRWGEAECNWLFGLALAQQGQREAALPLLRGALGYEQEIGHTKAAEHAAFIACLEAGEDLSPELAPIAGQRAVGEGADTAPDAYQP